MRGRRPQFLKGLWRDNPLEEETLSELSAYQTKVLIADDCVAGTSDVVNRLTRIPPVGGDTSFYSGMPPVQLGNGAFGILLSLPFLGLFFSPDTTTRQPVEPPPVVQQQQVAPATPFVPLGPDPIPYEQVLAEKRKAIAQLDADLAAGKGTPALSPSEWIAQNEEARKNAPAWLHAERQRIAEQESRLALERARAAVFSGAQQASRSWYQ